MSIKVKLRTGFAGPRGVWDPGQVVDLEPHEARRLVALGHAELVDGSTLPKATPQEDAAARMDLVETVEVVLDPDGVEIACKVRPRRKGAGRRAEKFRLPPVTIENREED